MTSPELTGGTGFTYEDAVAAYFLVAMVGGTTTTGLASRVVQRVAQQQANFGEPLDDVIVDAVAAADGSVMRLSLQVKRSLTVSDAATNTDFREVIQRSWQTLQKPTFREHVDRVGAATGTVTEETFRNFTTVCEFGAADRYCTLRGANRGGNSSGGDPSRPSQTADFARRFPTHQGMSDGSVRPGINPSLLDLLWEPDDEASQSCDVTEEDCSLRVAALALQQRQARHEALDNDADWSDVSLHLPQLSAGIRRSGARKKQPAQRSRSPGALLPSSDKHCISGRGTA